MSRQLSLSRQLVKKRQLWFSVNDVLEEEEEETPIHLRPYQASKYEVPSKKIKYATGYAMLDVDPFPRATIMKLCYAIMDRLDSPHIPSESMYKVYTEEMVKFFMNLTDQIEDVKKLEEELGFDSIEIFIQNLRDELELVGDMEKVKPWTVEGDLNHETISMPREELRHMMNQREEREKVKFINSQ